MKHKMLIRVVFWLLPITARKVYEQCLWTFLEPNPLLINQRCLIPFQRITAVRMSNIVMPAGTQQKWKDARDFEHKTDFSRVRDSYIQRGLRPLKIISVSSTDQAWSCTNLLKLLERDFYVFYSSQE